ncbi:MAG: twin-arginine translocase TatA/TatE family subunit [Candidatus Saccharibacteria bacterium]
MNLGKTEIILLIVAVVIVLIVGGKKLPELARGVGQAGKELRKGFSGDKDKKDSDEEKK